MPVTNTSNYTTLYSTTAGAVAPQQPYGNANVEAFLNVGTDGGNTVENILANGAITANGNIHSEQFLSGQNFIANNNLTSIGANAGNTTTLNANANSIAIGSVACFNQGDGATALGYYAGRTNQAAYGVAIGAAAGETNQNNRGVAVGYGAGSENQGNQAVAIGGDETARYNQSALSIAIGSKAGKTDQGTESIAVGFLAGLTTQGSQAIAIGSRAGVTNQASNSIVLNATGSNLNQTVANTFTVKPVRNANTANVMYYNNTTGEITYDALNVPAVANANFANFAGNVTNSAQPNITSVGTLVNLTVTGNITSTSGVFVGDGSGLSNINVSNITGNANFANFAGNVTNSAQPNITSVGTLVGLDMGGNITANANVTYDIGNSTNRFKDIWLSNSTIYLGNANLKSDDSNNTFNISVTGLANAVVISNSLANFNIPITANGNITTNNTIVANAANLTGSYNINSAGYYFPDFIPITTPLNYNANTPGFIVSGTVTTGSNLITGVTLQDYRAVTSFSLSDWGSYLLNERVAYTDSVGGFSDFVFPIGTFISNVDAANSQITVSNNSSVTSTVPMLTGALLSNASSNTYLLTQQPTFAVATATDATSNAVTLSSMTQFATFGATTGYPVQFLGTGFGNITVGTQYYVGNIDVANSQITISTSNTGSPSLQLTTATGNLLAVTALENQTVRPLNGGYYFAGPWSTNPPSISNFTEAPSGTIIGNATFITSNAFVKPVDFNSNVNFPPQLSGQFTRIQNGLLVSDDEYGTATLFGGLDDPFPLAGIGALHTGISNTAIGRTNFQIVNYTDNGADSASITNPGNPPAFSFTAFTGNVNTNVNDNYLRSGRTIGRIAWFGAMQNNGVRYVQPGSSPVAGVYVQALGDWNNSVNANLPMVMAFQYSPLNAAGSTPNYQRINRTFLQAANNTTTIGGATNIEFRPLARGTNATNNRSPSALGNVSINPQKFVDISGYTTGDAVSNGAGALLNVTTTASTWNGNVALRLSRTVGNTANMEFRLPTANANTMVLVDNASGNTIATFTNGDVRVANLTLAGSTSGNIKLTAGATPSAQTYTLPNAYPTVNNQVLVSTTGGTMSWATSGNIAPNYLDSNYTATIGAITANTIYGIPVTSLSATNITIATGTIAIDNATATGPTRITFSQTGRYNLQFSIQLENTDNAADHLFDIWLRKNGADVAETNTQYTVVKNNGKIVAALNLLLNPTAVNDYYELVYAVSDAAVGIKTIAAQTTPFVRPLTPGIIVTVVPVGA